MESKRLIQMLSASFFCFLLSLGMSEPVNAAGFDCDAILSGASTDTDCRRHWVENQEVRALHWYQGLDEFSVSIEGRTPHFNISSPRPPYLVDVDNDGFADLVFFSLLGMVNGDYEFHRFNPHERTFEPIGITTGSSFHINNTGVLVTVARSSCCESGASVHQIVDNRLVPIFHMTIRPKETSTPEPRCQVFPEGFLSREEIEKEYANLVAAFCDYHQDAGQAAIPALALWVDHIDTQASMWADVMGGGPYYHGAEFRLGFHHTHNARQLMNADGAKRWVALMVQALDASEVHTFGETNPSIVLPRV